MTTMPTGRPPANRAPARGSAGGAAGRSWDEALAARLVGGDQHALADAYDQYSSFVFGLARRVTGDPRAAEDVTQEVFIALWERPEAFDAGRGSLRTWLATLAHRRAVDFVRREEARRRRTEREAARATSVPNVEESALALVTAERVRAAVEALPSEQRQAIELAYFGGKTYREVADALGIPEGTAKSRLRLGLRRIATELEGMEDDGLAARPAGSRRLRPATEEQQDDGLAARPAGSRRLRPATEEQQDDGLAARPAGSRRLRPATEEQQDDGLAARPAGSRRLRPATEE